MHDAQRATRKGASDGLLIYGKRDIRILSKIGQRLASDRACVAVVRLFLLGIRLMYIAVAACIRDVSRLDFGGGPRMFG